MTDYSILAQFILDTYLANISGNNLPEEFVMKDPESGVMIGKLAAGRVQKSLAGGYVENGEKKFKSIPSINLSFSVKKDEQGELMIKPRGLLMYTVKPDYQKTVAYTLEYLSQFHHQKYTSLNDLDGYQETFELPLTYRKVQIEDYIGDGFSLKLNGLTECEFSLQESIGTRLQDLLFKISSEIRVCRRLRVSIYDLKSKEAFERATAPKEERVNPAWQFDIFSKVTDQNDSWLISMQMVNRTLVDNSDLGYIPVIFDAGLSVSGNEHVKFNEIELENLKASYKERDPIYATAENTSVRYDCSQNKLITDNVPYFIQYRLKTNDSLDQYTSFDALLRNPLGNLKRIASEMRQDHEKCVLEHEENKNCLSKEAEKRLEDALKKYEDEIRRFEKGISMVECRDFVKRAFQYTLMTFQMQFDGDRREIRGWRLFQLVFIVSMIPEVVRNEYPDDLSNPDINSANLLYFPTGGGKTEAFLGVCVFTMFFDRLRGKNMGITAFLKYPLRLLAVQQLDRALTVIVKANQVLHSIAELEGSNEFQIGFYVGSSVTPNKIKESELPDGETLNQLYKFIDTCPVCGKRMVSVRYDETRKVLRHFCDNPECDCNELPLLIIDDEIYRYLPSLVICTIDKMAALGLNSDFKAMLGGVKTHCKVHGYSVTSSCSCQKCHEPVASVGKLKDPIPTLFIQDEMHLVKESLGTFDAHYEAFIDYFAKSLAPVKYRKHICYIGATATISQYAAHVQHLYHRFATRFPCEYPSRSADHDFYSYIDKSDISRILTGFAPYGTNSIMDGMWRSVYEMHKLICLMINDKKMYYGKLKSRGFAGTARDFANMLYDYWVELVYNNTKNDADELMNSFTNQANNTLGVEGLEKFVIESMTSDEGFQTVRRILFDIKANHCKLDSTNLILATSTISHGVDEDSFNSMFFFGIPNNNAEYVQAYSRVGRKYTGIVVDIIRLLRLRDRSYLRNFVIFHANKDDLIETVPINRWARNAIYSTLPGLLSGLCLQYYNLKERIKGHESESLCLKKMLQNGEIDPDDVSLKIIEMLGCGASEVLSKVYIEIIKTEVKHILESIRNSSNMEVMSLGEAISKFSTVKRGPMSLSTGKRGPMTSLRDTEEQVFIDIKN